MVKDPGHHQSKTQKKAIREARREEAEKEEQEQESNPQPEEEQEGVEIEDQPTVKRPLNRRYH